MSKLDDKDLTKVAAGGTGDELLDLAPRKDRDSVGDSDSGGGGGGGGEDIEDLPGRGGGSRGVE